jgi:NADPH2:quinone reductase
MRALVCEAFGGAKNLRLGELPDPGTPGPGEVRIRVTAAGVNFADLLMVAGNYQVKPPLPFAPGFEVAGTIEALGPGVTGLSPDASVMAFLDHGGFAEIATAPADMVFSVPERMSDIVAAGFPIAYGTSHLGLVRKAGLKAGEVLLVHGAAGGVGLAAVEIGKALGATVVATAGGADKCRVALTMAPITRSIIDPRTSGNGEVLVGGADVVFDPVARCSRPRCGSRTGTPAL